MYETMCWGQCLDIFVNCIISIQNASLEDGMDLRLRVLK